MNPDEDSLQPGTVTPEQQRSAAVTLADRALIVTGWTEEADAAGTWDEETAKAVLRQALEVIGAVPYPRAHNSKYHFGAWAS